MSKIGSSIAALVHQTSSKSVAAGLGAGLAVAVGAVTFLSAVAPAARPIPRLDCRGQELTRSLTEVRRAVGAAVFVPRLRNYSGHACKLPRRPRLRPVRPARRNVVLSYPGSRTRVRNGRIALSETFEANPGPIPCGAQATAKLAENGTPKLTVRGTSRDALWEECGETQVQGTFNHVALTAREVIGIAQPALRIARFGHCREVVVGVTPAVKRYEWRCESHTRPAPEAEEGMASTVGEPRPCVYTLSRVAGPARPMEGVPDGPLAAFSVTGTATLDQPSRPGCAPQLHYRGSIGVDQEQHGGTTLLAWRVASGAAS